MNEKYYPDTPTDGGNMPFDDMMEDLRSALRFAEARAEKAEADLLVEQRVLAGFKVMLETANTRVERMQAELTIHETAKLKEA